MNFRYTLRKINQKHNSISSTETTEQKRFFKETISKKSTVSCSSNQQCHFDHSVIAHAIAETLLCDKSPVKIKGVFTMNDLNVRELKGLDIANRYTIKEENGIWFVPSSSGRSEKYKVCLE